MRPFRFLADIGELAPAAAVAERARRMESMGYDVAVFPDHLIEGMPAPFLHLAAAAFATTTLRVGTFVLNNDLRHPVLLAQEAATLDVLSGGRLELGIGAGWNVPEYERTGIAFDPVPTRVARLAEAIAVIKGALAATADAPFSFDGAFYRISGLSGLPRPVQAPNPPFFIGGGGRRTLELAGREAAMVGLAPRIAKGTRLDPHSITLAATEEKIAWARAAAVSAGRDPDALEFNTYPSGTAPEIVEDPREKAREVIDRLRERSGVELSETEVLDSPHMLFGTVESLVEKFTMLRERLGISSFMVGDPDTLAPVVGRLAGS